MGRTCYFLVHHIQLHRWCCPPSDSSYTGLLRRSPFGASIESALPRITKLAPYVEARVVQNEKACAWFHEDGYKDTDTTAEGIREARDG